MFRDKKKNDRTDRPSSPKRWRKAAIAVGAAFALFAAALLALPAVLSSNFARGRIVAAVATATGRPTSLRRLHFTWTDGLRLSGLRIGRGEITDPQFLCSLEQAHAAVETLPLFRGKVGINLELDGLRLRVRIPKTPPTPLPQTLRKLFSGLRLALTPTRLPLDVAVHLSVKDAAAHLLLPNGAELGLRRVALSLNAPSLKTAPLSCRISADPLTGGKRRNPIHLELNAAGLCDAAGRIDLGRARLAAGLEAPAAHAVMKGDLTRGLTAQVHLDLQPAAAAYGPLIGKLPQTAGDVTFGMALVRGAPSAPGKSRRLKATADLRMEGLRLGFGPRGHPSLGPITLDVHQNALLDAAAETALLPGGMMLTGGTQAGWTVRLAGVRSGRPRLAIALSPLRLRLAPLLAATKGLLPPGFSIGSADLTADGLELGVRLPETPQAKVGLTAKAQSVSLDVGRIMRRSSTAGLGIGRVRLSLTGFRADLPGTRPARIMLHAAARATDIRTGGTRIGSAALGGVKIDLTGTRPDALSLQASAHMTDILAGGMRITDVRCGVEKAVLSLPKGRPGSASLLAGLRLAGVRLAGGTPTTINLVNSNKIVIAVRHLAPDAAALFGVRGSASLTLDAGMRGLAIADKAAVPELHESLKLRAELPAAKNAALKLDELRLAARSARLTSGGRPPVAAPFALRISAPRILLGRTGREGAFAATLPDAQLTLDLGKALHAAARLSLTGRNVTGEGSLILDAQRGSALLTAFLPQEAGASGLVTTNWRVSASLPGPAQTAATQAGGDILQRMNRLRFLHHAELVLSLKNFNLDWPLPAQADGKPQGLHLRHLDTLRPLRLTTRDGATESGLDGELAFGPVRDLPGLGMLDRPITGLIAITAGQQGLRSAKVNETLDLDGGGLRQKLSLAVDKLNRVLGRPDQPAEALKHLDATLAFQLTGSLDALPARHDASGGLGGSGRIEAGADVRLEGGHSLTVAGRLLSPGLNLSLGPKFSLTGLTSTLNFRRNFSIGPELACPGKKAAEAPPLSEQVFEQSLPTLPSRREEAVPARLLAPNSAPAMGKLSIKRARIAAGPLPLTLHNVEIRLDTDAAVPGVRSLRAGLLGGGILGGAGVRRTAEGYVLTTDLAFSNIDPGRLFPAKVPRDLGNRAETSGRVSLSIPLTPDAETFLQKLLLRADITKIGPRTLERLLYALDPEERNETLAQQRRLIAIGYPRRLHLNVAYGNLSLSGAVTVKGMRLDLPSVNRLNIANLPIRDELAGPLAKVPGLIRVFDAAGGSVICRGENGGLRVVRPAASQGAKQ